MLVAILGGGAVGLVSGLVVSVLVLQLKRLRNGLLVRRGGLPLKDVIRPPLAVPCAVGGAVLGGGLSTVVEPALAAAIGGGTLPGLLLLLFLAATLSQLRDRTSAPEPPPSDLP